MSRTFLAELFGVYNYFAAFAEVASRLHLKGPMRKTSPLIAHHVLWRELERIVHGKTDAILQVYSGGGGEWLEGVIATAEVKAVEHNQPEDHEVLAGYQKALNLREELFMKTSAEVAKTIPEVKFDPFICCKNLLVLDDQSCDELANTSTLHVVSYVYMVRRLIARCVANEPGDSTLAQDFHPSRESKLMDDYYRLFGYLIRGREQLYGDLLSTSVDVAVINHLATIFPPVLVNLIMSFEFVDNEVMLQRALKNSVENSVENCGFEEIVISLT